MTEQELSAAIAEVRERARANAPQGQLGPDGVFAPNLMPLLHARDAAEAKVAAIGTVNPRPAGLVNSIAQGVKKLVARALDWHVREQVEFNRATMECVQASLEAFTTLSRSLSQVVGDLEYAKVAKASLEEFEERQLKNEVRILRTISELQAAYSHRLSLMEQTTRDLMHGMHQDYEGALDRATVDVQQRLWDDLAKSRLEFERLIHNELRILRQRPLQQVAAAAPAIVRQAEHPVQSELPVDWQAFAARFRGSEDRIRAQQQRYVDRFRGTSGVILDIGCGRGEFLEAAKAAGLLALGIDLDLSSVDVCRAKGLDAEVADLFAHLEAQADHSAGGVYCAQVVEHLTPASVARFVELLGRKVRSGGLVAIETPNPECLAIFATHFYIDPTHTRPVPALLLRYYLEEAGFAGIEVEYLEPAVDSMPELGELPAGVREKFFGGLDYSIFARKL